MTLYFQSSSRHAMFCISHGRGPTRRRPCTIHFFVWTSLQLLSSTCFSSSLFLHPLHHRCSPARASVLRSVNAAARQPAPPPPTSPAPPLVVPSAPQAYSSTFSSAHHPLDEEKVRCRLVSRLLAAATHAALIAPPLTPSSRSHARRIGASQGGRLLGEEREEGDEMQGPYVNESREELKRCIAEAFLSLQK